jgi:hypothetical protein
MIRKLLLVAAAIAMPVSVVAVTGVAAYAKTPVPPDPAVTCTVSGSVNFAPPGISQNGAVSASKTSTTTTSATTFGGAGCSGGSGPNTITSKSTKCDKHTAGQPSSNPACTPGNYGYGSWSNFVSGGTTSIQKALKKLNFTIGAIAYQTKTTGASEILPGASNPCGSNEVGFQIVGTVKAPKNDKGQTSTLNACLGAITGTGLNPGDNFLAAAVDQIGTVQTAQIDPTFSTASVG